MIRAFQIAVVSDSRPKTPNSRLKTQDPRPGSRVVGFVSCVLLSFCLIGCTGPEEEEPVWEKVKIGDLAPYRSGKPPQAQLLKTINFDVDIFEIPAENISKLDDICSGLRAKYRRPMRFDNPHAFSANSFSVCFGQIPMWNRVGDLLLAAGGQKITKASLLLADGQAESIVVAGLDSPRTVFFTSTSGSREGANVGPGILGLRIKAEKIPGLRGVCNVNACPVFSPPILSGSIPQLTARAKLREFPFTSAAFGLRMSPGDFVFLGPEKYFGDQTTLGGLFFSKPEGSLFFSATERKGPEHKPAVRIFLLVCTGINY
ncbi:hypothetical protein ES703_106734 [subsurface metagenome]